MAKTTDLARIDTTTTALAQITDVREIKQYAAALEGIKDVLIARQATASELDEWAEKHLRVVRRGGELLAKMPKAPGISIVTRGSSLEPVPITNTYTDIGITKHQAFRWQAIAELPGKRFESYILTAHAQLEDDKGHLSLAGAYREWRRWKREQKFEQAGIELPKGKYRTVVIDPPWPIQKIDREAAEQQHRFAYKTQSVEEIAAFPIEDMLHEAGTHIYLWTTQKHLPASFGILASWGVKYLVTMVWHKAGGFQPFNLPQYNCEFVLLGRTGGLDFKTTKDFPCCFKGKRREHSQKPNEFYDLVKRVSPAPRIDVFSREKRSGFTQWGDETGKFDG